MMQRFSFLERKGLTREEIEEAFRRCPDPPTTDASKSLVRTEGRVSTPAQSGGHHQMGTQTQAQPVQQYGVQHTPSIVPARAGPTWSQLVLGAGLIAAAGAGTGYLFQKVLAPRLKTWLRDMLIEDRKPAILNGEEQGKGPKLTPLDEAVNAAAVAANAAAAAAAEVANTSREVLKLQTEEWQQFRSFIGALDKKTEELKGTLASMSKNIQTTHDAAFSTSSVLPEDARLSKPYMRTWSPAEQVQTSQGVQGMNGVDKVFSNGHSTNFNSHTSQSEDEPWWRRKKVEVETYSSPKKFVESTLQIAEADSELNQEIGSTLNRAHMGRAGWVPPPAPHTVMPGAASAIRYQKPATSDETKGAYVLEEKDTELRKRSGSLDASSSIRVQNSVSLDEARKAKIVTEDSLKVNEAQPSSSSAGWYQRSASVDGTHPAFTSDFLNEVGSQQPQSFSEAGTSGVSSLLRSQGSDEARHTIVVDAPIDKVNLRSFPDEKETTFELPKAPEKITDVVEISTFETAKVPERPEITSMAKEALSSSSLGEITGEVA